HITRAPIGYASGRIRAARPGGGAGGKELRKLRPRGWPRTRCRAGTVRRDNRCSHRWRAGRAMLRADLAWGWIPFVTRLRGRREIAGLAGRLSCGPRFLRSFDELGYGFKGMKAA